MPGTLAPSNLRTLHDPLTMGPLAIPRWLPHPARRALWHLVDARLIDAAALPTLNEDRRTHGLAPVTRFIEHLQSVAQASVTLFPPWFGAVQPDWPRPLVPGAFVLHAPDAADALPAAVRVFLYAGTPPVVFTAGTGQVHASAVFAAALEATREAGRCALLLTPERAQVPAMLPDGALWLGYVPLGALLPHAAAIVPHGGIGTAAEALRAGTPQLVVPWAYDQFDNGARVHALGAGRVSRLASRRPSRLAPALHALLADDAVGAGCHAIAARFDGDAEAARLRSVVDAIVAPAAG